VLFSDVEGSTDLRTREGDDVAQEVLRHHERMLRDELERHQGQEVVFMGDGFMVAFASARKAIECAIGIERRFEEHNRTGPHHEIRVRIGLNTGEVLRESGTLYGTSVNAAARISAKAKGGQILVSQVTKDLTSGVRDFTFMDRGMFSLKGFPTQWRLYEVAWRDHEASSGTAPQPVPRPHAQSIPPGGLEETYPRPELGPIVGRVAEREALEQDLDAVRTQRQIRVFAVEGEAGIGKTRLMESALAAAGSKGFGAVMVGGDEELRGPFFLLRTLLSSGSIESLADEAMARDALERAREVLWGRSPGASGLSPAEQTLRVYDVATLALRAIAETRSLALFLDDLQWADEDSLKLIRYLVRTSSASPMFLMLAHRLDAGGTIGSSTTLAADLERMRIGRRLRLERLSRAETAELLEHLLGSPVGPQCATTLHQRGEGVPFFIVEFAQAFRDAGLFQNVGGRMEVSAAARSTVAPSVQILIERRLAQLPPDARELVSDAAVEGRRFRLAELAAVRSAVGGTAEQPGELAARIAPALEANLIATLPEDASYDYTFTHDEIRSVLLDRLGRARRRAVHGAIANMLAEQGEGAACIASLAFHSLEGGDDERGVQYSIKAARSALESFAPEEALRAVDAARSATASPDDRSALLCLRDQALEALGRPEDRLATLAELSALVRARGDEALDVEVTLRRASAARQADDHDQAAALAEKAFEAARARGDRHAQLRAALEKGQSLLRQPLGESYSPPTTEVDIDAAAEAYERAWTIASELGDESTVAAIRREQGVIRMGQLRKWILEQRELHPDLFFDPEFDPRQVPEVTRGFAEARGYIAAAIETYERLGDSRGLMSSLIAMAYGNIIEETPHGHAGRVEQIRRLRRGLRRLTSESERIESEAHMLYSIHVYARCHGPMDLALHRGVETFETARTLGDGQLQFLAAGGVALTYAALGQIDEAEHWIDRAGKAALASSGALPERQLETWRGAVRASAGDAAAMRRHLERALTIATDRGSPAGRCELLALLATESARLGAGLGDEDLLTRARAWAEDAGRLARGLPKSDAPWEAQAEAALAQVALARGDADAAIEHGLASIAELRRIRQFFAFLFPETRLLAARALDGFEDPRVAEFLALSRRDFVIVAYETRDDDIRARWLRSPVIRELMERVGGADAVHMESSGAVTPAGLTETQVEMLKRVMSGQTDREIAAAMTQTEEAVAEELGRIFAALGAASRGQASAAALAGGIV
jgi:class 3 adenylate cyclase/DNA-binding CsgD family transcriptional regulator/tetratricopeptide (TPR) repeat protein